MFWISVLESGKEYEVDCLKIWKITEMEEMNDDFEVDLMADPGPLEDAEVIVEDSDVPAQKEFMSLKDDDEIEKLADNQQARETVNQTHWAVRIFKGKHQYINIGGGGNSNGGENEEWNC